MIKFNVIVSRRFIFSPKRCDNKEQKSDGIRANEGMQRAKSGAHYHTFAVRSTR